MRHNSVKMLNLLSSHGFFQAENAPKPFFSDGELTTLPDSLVSYVGDTPPHSPPPRSLRRIACANFLCRVYT